VTIYITHDVAAVTALDPFRIEIAKSWAPGFWEIRRNSSLTPCCRLVGTSLWHCLAIVARHSSPGRGKSHPRPGRKSYQRFPPRSVFLKRNALLDTLKRIS